MLADRYVRMDFTSQEDFEKNFSLHIPDRFNFAYDIVDEYAKQSPDKLAMVWCNVAGEERTLHFPICGACLIRRQTISGPWAFKRAIR